MYLDPFAALAHARADRDARLSIGRTRKKGQCVGCVGHAFHFIGPQDLDLFDTIFVTKAAGVDNYAVSEPQGADTAEMAVGVVGAQDHMA